MERTMGRTGIESLSPMPLGAGRAARSYRQGRVCASAGCRTVLSRYNAGSRCSLHDHLL